jgi:hypothetical protein
VTGPAAQTISMRRCSTSVSGTERRRAIGPPKET